MFIYTQFVTESRLTSPVNGYSCRRINKQNIKQFGFDSIEDLHKEYPGFPLMCNEYKNTYDMSKGEKFNETKKRVKKEYTEKKHTEKQKYDNDPLICPKCGLPKTFEKRNNQFCSRKCANGRGPRSEYTKRKISEKIKSMNLHIQTIEKTCPICKNNFKTRKATQKFCSRKCNTINNINKIKYSKKSDYTKNKISKTRKKLFTEGILDVTGGNTEWIKYKNIKVQGTYEFRMCHVLDNLKETNKIKDWSYTNDRIQYKNINNEISTYILDFKVTRNDDTYFYIETKGYVRDNDTYKWEACKEKGIELHVFFGNDIKRIENGKIHTCFIIK